MLTDGAMNSSDWRFCQQSLKEVSRTFSLPIAMLRDPLERAVTCGYLLCRIADTIEDESNLTLAERDGLYLSFLECLEQDASASDFASRFPDNGERPASAERRLVKNLPRVLGVFAELNDSSQRAIRRGVCEMARGMAIYSRRPTGEDGIVALTTLADLERYCYFVAGTVAHMLTDLFTDTCDLDAPRTHALRTNAEEFGVGLQMTNILKDITNDWERGVCYVPRTVCQDAGLEVAELLQPEARERAHTALAPLFKRAQRGFEHAFTYCLAIPPNERDIRLFCLLPLWMAVRTLAYARRNDAQLIPGEPVKISHGEVEKLIQDCVEHVEDDEALRTSFCRLSLGPVTISPQPRSTLVAGTSADVLSGYMASRRELVEIALDGSLPNGSTPDQLADAVRYPVFAGGKRLRPILALAAAESVGAAASDAIMPALAVELIHTYSLVHDDLPALDNDDLRRGKPTTHKVYGEAMAILVGDALLTRAFELLADPTLTERIGASRAIRLVHEISSAVGAHGMVGGQVIDILSDGQQLDTDALIRLYRMKTAALLRTSIVAGGIAGGATDEQIEQLAIYGERVGLAFQIVDDILDVTSSTEQLGKPQGSDARHRKATFASVLGVENSRERTKQLIHEAKEAIIAFGNDAHVLRELADFVGERTH